MKHYNGWELTEDPNGPLVKWDDVAPMIFENVEDMPAFIQLRARIAALETQCRELREALKTIDAELSGSLPLTRWVKDFARELLAKYPESK